jgi:hypothetical protein
MGFGVGPDISLKELAGIADSREQEHARDDTQDSPGGFLRLGLR